MKEINDLTVLKEEVTPDIDGGCAYCGTVLIDVDKDSIYSNESGKRFCCLKCFKIYTSVKKADAILLCATDGGKNHYYDIFSDCTDLDSLVLKFPNMSPFMFNALKAMIGILQDDAGNGSRHGGTNVERDLNKILHYVGKEKERRCFGYIGERNGK